MENLTIPVSVKSVANDVFDSFYLDNVYYEGTIAQWRQVSIGSGNNDLVDTFISYAAEPTDISAHNQDYSSIAEGEFVINRKGVLYWLPKKKKIAAGVKAVVPASDVGCLYILKKNGQLWLIPYNQKLNEDGYKKKKLMSGVAKLPENIFTEPKDGLYVIKRNGQLWLAGKYESVNKLSKPKRIMTGVKEVYCDVMEPDSNDRKIKLTKMNVFALRKDGSLWAWGEPLGKGGTFDSYDYNGDMQACKIDEGVKYVYHDPDAVYYIKENDRLWHFGGGRYEEGVSKPKLIASNARYAYPFATGCHIVKKNGTLFATGSIQSYYYKNYGKTPKKIMGGMAVK